MTDSTSPRITTQPRSAPWIDAAVEAGGGTLVEPAAATAVIWTRADDPAGLSTLLADHPSIRWVQLPWAGVEPYRDVFDHHRVWSCAKGVYAEPVAEHALALLLAGFRQLHQFSRATTWTSGAGRNLLGARITILGGGGIAEALIRLLGPFGCPITVVRRRPAEMPGTERVVGSADLHDSLRGADAVVLALPLLPETRQVIGAAELALLAPGARVVNVARGEHLDTAALVAALGAGQVGGAGLDVTDPEPLPNGHPLWTQPNVIITPHTGNTAAMARPLLSARITTNVRRYAAGETLEGLVDPDLGY